MSVAWRPVNGKKTNSRNIAANKVFVFCRLKSQQMEIENSLVCPFQLNYRVLHFHSSALEIGVIIFVKTKNRKIENNEF